MKCVKLMICILLFTLFTGTAFAAEVTINRCTPKITKYGDVVSYGEMNTWLDDMEEFTSLAHDWIEQMFNNGSLTAYGANERVREIKRFKKYLRRVVDRYNEVVDIKNELRNATPGTSEYEELEEDLASMNNSFLCLFGKYKGKMIDLKEYIR